jgi:hypothetical protein
MSCQGPWLTVTSRGFDFHPPFDLATIAANHPMSDGQITLVEGPNDLGFRFRCTMVLQSGEKAKI